MAGFIDDNTERFTYGSKEEIFKVPIGAVVLMDYDEDQKVSVLAGGAFSVNLIICAAFNILACVCSVASFQWPVTKDTVIVRMAVRTFAIAMPGLLYGLQFPKLIPDIFIENLLTIFTKFSLYLDLNDNHQGYPLEDNTANIWNIMRPRVEAMANEALTRLGQPTGKSRFNIENKNSCYRRAFRMSSITKFVVDCMVHTGTLTHDHLVSFGSEVPHVEQVHGVLYPSINVFTCLVDSMELIWVVVFSNGLDEIKDMLQGAEIPLHGTCDDLGYCLWSVNENGLVALLRILLPLPSDGRGRSAAANEREEVEVKVEVKNENNENEKLEVRVKVKVEVDEDENENEKEVEVDEDENKNKKGKGKERKKWGGGASTSANNIKSNVKP